MAELHVLRVFVDERGGHGNPLGVFPDCGEPSAAARQAIAAELGFSETVFVEDRSVGRIRIHTPTVELPFAGHPTVGTAWLLTMLADRPVERLHPPAGELEARVEGDSAHVAGRPEWAPAFSYRRHGSAAEVDALDPSAASGNVYAWAWLEESSGLVRSRSFVPEEGIEEDEATGSAAMALCAQLGRALTIRQGRGSVIRARPLGDRRIEIGGRVAHDETREHPIG